MPVILVGLVYLRVLKTGFLRCQRKVIVLFIFILAAVLNPKADVLTQCLLAFPLWGLFELSLLEGRKIENGFSCKQKASEEVMSSNVYGK